MSVCACYVIYWERNAMLRLRYIVCPSTTFFMFYLTTLFSISDYVASNEKMIVGDELEMWLKAEVARFQILRVTEI